MSRVINWTRDKLKALVEARNTALEARQTEFKVLLPDERVSWDFDVRYAGHVIEYLERAFAEAPERRYPPNLEGREGQ